MIVENLSKKILLKLGTQQRLQLEIRMKTILDSPRRNGMGKGFGSLKTRMVTDLGSFSRRQPSKRKIGLAETNFFQVQTSVFLPTEIHMLQPKKILHHLVISICLAALGFHFPGQCLTGIRSCPVLVL